MSSYKPVDIENWSRKSLFELFGTYDDPFFNMTTALDVSKLFYYCKANKRSFFLACLYYSIKVANQIPEFRMRLLDGQLVEYDRIHPGSTVLHDDNSFSFCYFEFLDSFDEFERAGKAQIEEQQRSKKVDPKLNALNMIHYSVIPWIAFTSFKHARRFDKADSFPKIVFGKVSESDGKAKIPISVEVNHSIMDGYHMGLFFDLLQKEFDGIEERGTNDIVGI